MKRLSTVADIEDINGHRLIMNRLICYKFIACSPHRRNLG
jgi:hypothetical protein